MKKAFVCSSYSLYAGAHDSCMPTRIRWTTCLWFICRTRPSMWSIPMESLSAQTVQQMDSLLYRLETEKGVQSVVAVVERIRREENAMISPLHWVTKLGVGNRQNTGLIILLSTQDRCYQILTGEGLEGHATRCHLPPDRKPANGALPENRRLGYRHAANSVCRL